MQKKSLTTRDISVYCDVTQRTVVQWINEGKIKAYRTPGNHIRIKREDFFDFLNRFKMPVPDEFKEGLGKDRNKGKRVLIVDDDREMVNSIKRVLIKEHFDIEVAYDGFSAGLRLNDFNPEIVLLDIKMPGFDGYQVCANIRQNPKNQDMKILIISGMIDDDGIRKARELGADDVLQKPFDNKQLVAKIKDLFGWIRREDDKEDTHQ